MGRCKTIPQLFWSISKLMPSEERQALCESFDGYRAYQSGAYYREGLGYGYLVDQAAAGRIYMDGTVIITRAYVLVIKQLPTMLMILLEVEAVRLIKRARERRQRTMFEVLQVLRVFSTTSRKESRYSSLLVSQSQPVCALKVLICN